MLRCLDCRTITTLGVLALAMAAGSASAQSGVVYFGEIAPLAADSSAPTSDDVASSSHGADCPGGLGGSDEAGGDLDCGTHSDARRVPFGFDFGNWDSTGRGANTALGNGALASGPWWSPRAPVQLRWHHETDTNGMTGAVWADGANAACVSQLRASKVNHPDPDASCEEVKDGQRIVDANGDWIVVERADGWMLNELVGDRMVELGLKTDRFAHYFDADGNPISSPSDLSWNTAVGAGADARGYRSSNVALGHNAAAWGHGEAGNGASNIAIGARSDASGSFSNNVAIGTGATASGEDTRNIAIGAGATASGNSVAIGNGVMATDNEVRIGNRHQRVYIGGRDLADLWNNTGGGSVDDAAFRRLSDDVGLNSSAIVANADAIAANVDAIAANTEAIAANTEAIAPLVQEVGRFDERISRANATAAALSAVPNSAADKAFLVGFGFGSHESETAVAVGASGRIGKDSGVMFNGGMANSGDGTTVRVGVGLVW